MMDTFGDVIGSLIAIAVICFVLYFVLFVIYRTISSILYFFKRIKMTPAERNYQKRIRKKHSDSNGWWTFDSGNGSSSDCGGDSGGDGGGGGGGGGGGD